MPDTRLAIAGATGRMGRRLVALGHNLGGRTVVAATTRPDDPLLGQDAGVIAGIPSMGVKVGTSIDVPVDVVIDFSAPEGLRQWLPVCKARNIAMVVGTTGLTAADQQLIDDAAKVIPILQSTNMSLGVAVMNKVAALMAKMLGPDYDIEITETHHKHKKDAPSGTALTLLDHILQATGRTRDDVANGRHGAEALRVPGSVGMHSLRMGDVTGMHTAHFATDGERLELTHVATNRDVFVHGALRTASWLAKQKPGRYTMPDVLGV
ncbi:MAG: 4-hydroxy-tetrahydrodipicolinate reductase [Tepidisphaeraceae bacterium]